MHDHTSATQDLTFSDLINEVPCPSEASRGYFLCIVGDGFEYRVVPCFPELPRDRNEHNLPRLSSQVFSHESILYHHPDGRSRNQIGPV
ncbi:hypothetical protein V6N12_031516 [Hibiscus sabdariffa]|uniref:Uncharacterized protein n=1 Tax=Hibiscus sabdariffa TaxID=183260 RepID=A0ABR2CPH4_9ROSI